MALLLNFIAGSGLKMLALGIGKWLEMKRTRDLLLANAPIDKIKALQGGEDTLSPGGKATRRLLALMITGTWCFLLVWIVVFKPEWLITRMVDYTPGILFSWILGAKNFTTMTVSAGAMVLYSSFELMSFVFGFYFTKINKGG